jgi:anaphase-promoting complex subunit 3
VFFLLLTTNNAYLLQAVERRGDRDAALMLFDQAVKLAPENPLVRYRRSKILIAMKKYDVS